MTITAIGFTNKYYTLWQITEESKPLGNGHNYVTVHYNYIKNISYDKEKAFAQYPDAIFDENLRGKTQSWETAGEVWENVDVFRFGKYKYDKIADINDTEYIAWYWDQVCGEHKDYVSNELKNRGYEIRKYEYTNYDGSKTESEYLMSPEALENERINEDNLNRICNKLEKNEIIELVPIKNLDEFGEYRDGDVIYKFENYKSAYYNGYEYALPIKNGKAKRMKNKNLRITDYIYNRNNNIIQVNVKDFEIVK